MDVDRQAPVIAAGEIEIAADAETVWEVLADVQGWPAWNPAIATVRLDGPLRPGTRFKWKAGPGTITSTLRSVDRPRELGWTGRTLGIAAVHVYRLRPHDRQPRHTTVQTEETWSGLLARLLRRRLTSQLQASIDAGLAHLKTEAERR